MTLGINSPLVIPSLHARATVEKQQKDFTDVWDPLFIGYSAAVYYQVKVVDDPSEKDERFDAPEVRGSGYLEDARAG